MCEERVCVRSVCEVLCVTARRGVMTFVFVVLL